MDDIIKRKKERLKENILRNEEKDKREVKVGFNYLRYGQVEQLRNKGCRKRLDRCLSVCFVAVVGDFRSVGVSVFVFFISWCF